MIKIQKMAKQNLPEVFEISKEEFKQTSWTLLQFENELQKQDSLNLVGLIDEQVVCFFNSNFSFDELSILNIATKNTYKRKGYARAILEFVLLFCKQNGINKLFLEVKTSNLPAIAFYKGLGFTTLRQRNNYYKDGSDCLEMVLEL